MAASFISNHRHDVGYWHLADIPETPAFVRYRRHSDHFSMLAQNGSVANDPKRTFDLNHRRPRFEGIAVESQ